MISSATLKVAAVVGTRPEAIKMAPVIKALKLSGWCDCLVVGTAQHRDLLDQALELFGISIDIDLNIMRECQTLSSLTSRLFERLDGVFARRKPDVILAQGDTTTVMVASMVAFYRGIPFAHVEAGLRTGDLHNPFPEELNRIVAGILATMHFAPTDAARKALLSEGCAEETIFVTGNTVIDALLEVASRPLQLPLSIPEDHRLILMTAHRRENFGKPMADIFRAVLRIVECYSDIEVVYPVHPNPKVKALAQAMLSGVPRVHLFEPLDYQSLVAVLGRSILVLTDSGGIQEEAPALAKPVLVMRDETERPEAVEAGVAKLIGTQREMIVAEVGRLLDDPVAYNAMARSVSPYGDGKAAARIVRIIAERFLPGVQASGGRPEAAPAHSRQ